MQHIKGPFARFIQVRSKTDRKNYREEHRDLAKQLLVAYIRWLKTVLWHP